MHRSKWGAALPGQHSGVPPDGEGDMPEHRLEIPPNQEEEKTTGSASQHRSDCSYTSKHHHQPPKAQNWSPLFQRGTGGFEGSGAIPHYNKKLKPFARRLRADQTECENRLWAKVRRKQILDVQFYRQRPLGNYIVDFYAPKAKLVIEVDGFHHRLKKYAQRDEVRDAYLESQGLQVLRFSNTQIRKKIDKVMQTIFDTVSRNLEKE
ncbi:MAG: DUF559 domain-containing protein [bacterium]|nr:DUF559 domain-containing protein [bacterium]